jgi:hypothetical protein
MGVASGARVACAFRSFILQLRFASETSIPRSGLGVLMVNQGCGCFRPIGDHVRGLPLMMRMMPSAVGDAMERLGAVW